MEEVLLNWNKWVRQIHRWLSIAFTVVVILNGIAVAEKRYTAKLALSAVFVLALQFFSGLYLFGLPYAAKLRSSRSNTPNGSSSETVRTDTFAALAMPVTATASRS
jgi:hypothetical protein